MPKELYKLKEVDQSLIQLCAAEMIPMLAADKTLVHVKQPAFECWSESTNEQFQVQVIVTRCESDFMEPFTTEELRDFKHCPHQDEE